MKKIAIYTAVIGGYDDIRQPKVVDERFDYYLFTDHIETDFIGVWRLMPIPYSNPDRKLVSGYVKTHPKELLPNYDATLWMDSSILIMDDYIYKKIEELWRSDIELSSVKHPLRDCVYEEAYAILNKKYETPQRIHDWCYRLYKEGYPTHNGLFETGILFRKKDLKIDALNIEWWNCLNNNVKRDQLALNYCLWKTDINTAYILPEKEHSRNSSHFNFIQHVYGVKKKLTKQTLLQRFTTFIRNRVPNMNIWYKMFLKSIHRPYKYNSIFETIEFLICIALLPVATYNTIFLHYELYKRTKK